MNVLRDIVVLCKPTISLAILTAWLGVFMAPGEISLAVAFLSVLGTGLLVGAANTLNMAMEHDVDALMERTRTRPIASGRLSVQAGYRIGAVLAIAG